MVSAAILSSSRVGAEKFRQRGSNSNAETEKKEINLKKRSSELLLRPLHDFW